MGALPRSLVARSYRECGARPSHRREIHALASTPLLTATPIGDGLELHPGGSWTAANVNSLEVLSEGVTAEIDRSKTVKFDMNGLSELDTLGAWLLEKLSRRAMSGGHRIEVVDVADNYAGLIEEIRQVNRHNPAPVRAPNPVLVKLSEIGIWRANRRGIVAIDLT